jgi:hypothetical protein
MAHCFLKSGLISFLAVATAAAHAQLFGSEVVFDPTQSAHAVEQIAQGQSIFTNTVKLADNAIATYNLARQMATSPESLYQPLLSRSTYWMMLNQAVNTYGNSQLWTSSVNTGMGAALGYQQASIPPLTNRINGFANLSLPAQQQIAAQGATSDLNDAMTTSGMQTLGTIRANAQQRQSDINALIGASQSSDPSQHTEMATLQRINQALILLVEQQQEANQISEAFTLEQIVSAKQQQDSLKATFQQANQFEKGFNSIAPSYAGVAAAMRY